jgi:hypothetical protein
MRNEEGDTLCEVDIDNYHIFSPNIEDTELDIKVRLGKINFLFDPYTINNTIKFFRYNKY